MQRILSMFRKSASESKCPFLAKTNASVNAAGVCPVMHQSGAKTRKYLHSPPDIENHPLYPKRDGLKEGEFEGGIKWRGGEPHDYTILNEQYIQQRIGKWSDPNSLENVVSNLIKTLEMEITNKKDPEQWVSSHIPMFKYKANDGPWVETKGAVEKGSYNILLAKAEPKLFDTSMTFEESHEQFFTAFPDGFIWELLKVYSGPPSVAFTWRHWGEFNGEFNGNKGDKQLIEVFGFGSADVRMPTDEDPRIRIEQFQVYYDMDRFLAQLNGTPYTATPDAGFGNSQRGQSSRP